MNKIVRNVPRRRNQFGHASSRRSGRCAVRSSGVDAAGARSRRHADRGRFALQKLCLDPAAKSFCRISMRGMAAARPRRAEAPACIAQPDRLGSAKAASGRAGAGDPRKEPPAGRSCSRPPPTRFLPNNWRHVSASSIRCSRPTASEISRALPKRQLLRQLFPAGFIYAGDSQADLTVWRHASGIVLVNARKSVTEAARALGRPMLELSGRVGS